MTHFIKEIVNCMPYRVSQIKLLAVGDHHTILNHLIQLLVYILDEILSGSFQKKNLVIVVAMMG